MVVNEGHYDAGRDVCNVEVFKPEKSPDPLQERQDIVNHSPTIILRPESPGGMEAAVPLSVRSQF